MGKEAGDTHSLGGKSMAVQIIKATKIDSSGVIKRNERLRVAAYCRVSTDDEDQAKSYKSMVEYYTDFISKNNEWVFAGIYGDWAKSGTTVIGREGFIALINDCLNGKIDKVIVKSMSRFTRNVEDFIHYTRILKETNIEVYFDEDHMSTMNPECELAMSILGVIHQQEVINTAKNVTTGLHFKMSKGLFVGSPRCMGYDYDATKKELSINEEEAFWVRFIFERYVGGAGSTVIARELNENGCITIRGNPWTQSSVMGIIKNEKYCGDLLQGKTLTIDTLTHRRIKNCGETDKYLETDHHPPIISRAMFEQAHEIRMRRNGSRNLAVPGQRDKYSRKHAFSSMLECGFCGGNLTSRTLHSGEKYEKHAWQCVKSVKLGKSNCPDSKAVDDRIIEEAFVESYRLLCEDNKAILETFLARTEKALRSESTEKKLVKLQDDERQISKKRKKLLDGFADGIIEKEVYSDKDSELKKQICEIREQIEVLKSLIENQCSVEQKISDFRRALSSDNVLDKFDREVFESIIQKVIIGGYDDEGEADPYKITFIYKTGDEHSINDSKGKLGKKSKSKDKELCSLSSDKVKDLCSNSSNYARRDYCRNTKSKYTIILEFTHFVDFFSSPFAIFI